LSAFRPGIRDWGIEPRQWQVAAKSQSQNLNATSRVRAGHFPVTPFAAACPDFFPRRVLKLLVAPAIHMLMDDLRQFALGKGRRNQRDFDFSKEPGWSISPERLFSEGWPRAIFAL
jgi:hypothetical protein